MTRDGTGGPSTVVNVAIALVTSIALLPLVAAGSGWGAMDSTVIVPGASNAETIFRRKVL